MDGSISTAESVYSFSAFVDRVIDPFFRSSALIAPVGASAAMGFAASGMLWPAVVSGVIGLVGAVGVYARFVAPFRLKVTHLDARGLLDMPAPGAAGAGARALRVCFFSDMHLGEFKRQAWASMLVERINAEKPDLVLIGGDFVGKVDCCELHELFAPLAGLRAKHGVYAVLGNHDYGIPGPDLSNDLFELLPRFGVRPLRNGCVHIDDGLQLVGLDELWATGADFHGAAGACARSGALTLVLGHNPDVMSDITAEKVCDPRRTLFLFGHTHHGQIRVPFMPGAAIPIVGTLYRGVYKLPQGAVYVSAGTGENTSPTRLGTAPEIVVFDLAY